MKQEELLQFIFLFIFVILIAILVGSTVGKINLADASEAVSSVSITNVSFSTSGTSTGSVSKVWTNHISNIVITGTDLNLSADSEIVFTNASGGGSITKAFNCENFSSNYCFFTIDPFTVGGSWSGVIKFNGVVKKIFYFDTVQMCGGLNGERYNFSGDIDDCSKIVSSKALILCNSPATLTNSIVLEDNKCKWMCNSLGYPQGYPQAVDSCYFNVGTSIVNPTTSTSENSNGGVLAFCGISSATDLNANSGNLCATGSVTDFTVKSDGTGWTWKCVLSTNLDALPCSATKIFYGKCSYLDSAYSVLPTIGTCSSGTVSDFIVANNTASWKCKGSVGSYDSCNIVIGKCLYPNGVDVSTLPTVGTCSTGSASGFSLNVNTATWTCRGVNGATDSCSVKKNSEGKCSYLSSYSSLPTVGTCSVGVVSNFTNTGNQATWTCSGLTVDKCSVIEGKCASFNAALDYLPSTGLCSFGNASSSTITSTGWTWTCNGVNNGKNSSCSAIKKVSSTIVDVSKISLTPSSVQVGNVVTVKVTDDSLVNMESLVLVAKPILSTLSNQASASLSKCSDGIGFCGRFIAPDSAGEWSVSLYSSSNKNIQISSLKTFVITSNVQIPIINAPIISPSIVTAGESVLIKLSVSGSIRGVKVNLSSANSSFVLANSLQLGGCSDNKDLWCGTVKLPFTSPGGNWTVKVISYIDSAGSEKIITSNLLSSFVVKIPCSYNYSDWGNCNNGKKNRSVVSSFPSGCIDINRILEASCESVNCTAYNYSDWSDCLNGKRTRRLVSATPSGCLGNAVLEEACTVAQVSCSEDKWECGSWQECGSDNKQIRKCSIVFDCPLVSNSTPELMKDCTPTAANQNEEPKSNIPIVSPGNTTTVIPGINTTIVAYTKNDISLECSIEGITEVNTCQDYTAQSNIASSCMLNGISGFDQCKKYLLSKYPTLFKCQKLKPAECEVYINDVLLADLKSSLSVESKEKLMDYVGSVAVVNSQEQTISVIDKNTGESSAVRVGNIPITANNISVNLLSTKMTQEQRYLSPIAITFDSNGNGIPDDVEIRLGSNINKDTLVGVDKAIIVGKELEQPKSKKESLISGQLTVDQVNNKDGGIKFQGKSTPNQVLTLFIYSTMPIVITVKADSNGNWVYELDKALINGKHEAYVVINNSEGRILEASLPKPFFIDEARAVAMDEFVRIEDASSVSVPESSDNFIKTYVGAGLGFIFLLIVIFFFIRNKATEQEKQ